MDLASIRCFGCQQFGHLERDCPKKNHAADPDDDNETPWCGECDRRTRLHMVRRDDRDAVTRCQCHPAGRLPAQFKRCGECKAVIYEWDRNSECGSHEPVSKPKEIHPRHGKEKRMSEPFKDRAAVAAKVEWEGGIIEALEYGIHVRDMPVGDTGLTAAWQALEDAFSALQPLAATVGDMLEAAACEAEGQPS
jgi:hypothetical protein